MPFYISAGRCLQFLQHINIAKILRAAFSWNISGDCFWMAQLPRVITKKTLLTWSSTTTILIFRLNGFFATTPEKNLCEVSDVFRPFGRPVCRFRRLKNTFQVFFFHFYVNKNYVEVAINDFTMHLIISKWLRYWHAGRRGKQWNKVVETK